jgi:hypothetical protein
MCEVCESLPEHHPDWMKGMCEDCYLDWCVAWRASYNQDQRNEVKEIARKKSYQHEDNLADRYYEGGKE